MIKARASGSKVYLYIMKKGRQARHRIPRNSCINQVVQRETIYFTDLPLQIDSSILFFKGVMSSSINFGFI